MPRFPKRLALAALTLALTFAPLIGDACTTCVKHTVCNLDGSNCTTSISCSTSPGPCPLLS